MNIGIYRVINRIGLLNLIIFRNDLFALDQNAYCETSFSPNSMDFIIIDPALILGHIQILGCPTDIHCLYSCTQNARNFDALARMLLWAQTCLSIYMYIYIYHYHYRIFRNSGNDYMYKLRSSGPHSWLKTSCTPFWPARMVTEVRFLILTAGLI